MRKGTSTLLGCLAITGLAACGTPDSSDKNPPSSSSLALDNSDGGEIIVCPEGLRDDEVHIRSMSLAAKTLRVTVQYSGGCEDHNFTLCWNGGFLESDPVQADLRLAHNAHGDICDALPTEELAFDLSPLKVAYEQGYQSAEGTIILRLTTLRENYIF